ncbi:MAG: hypothetical protein SGI88_09395 [Candidatus Hydrogenedentes bacterium]|nr:hypothetical protein [Candidatus Hydrogenedentota bacterium]
MLLFAGTLFWNLGGRLLWGDEAETAVLAVNITKFGVPKAFDGVNYITLIGPGKDTNSDHIWIWSPWLDEYFAAASFAILGDTPFAARLPFALIGLAASIFFAFVTQQLFKRPEATLFATLLFVTNASLILHFRQCRYYSIVVLAQLALIYGYYLVYNRRAKPGVALLVAALVAQWYCNYILSACNAFALVLSIFAFRSYAPWLTKPLLFALVVFVTLAAPWLLYARPSQQASLIGFEDFGKKCVFYAEYVSSYVAPILIGIGLIRAQSRKTNKQTVQLLDDERLGLYFFLLPLFVAHATVLLITPGYFYRYLVPLIPILILYLAHMTSLIVDRRIRYGVMAAIFALYNLYPFVRVVQDIATPYQNALTPLIAYLNTHARPGDSLYVQDPALPIIFHTDLKVIDGRLTRRLDMNDLPDWILPDSPTAIGPVKPLTLPPQLASRYETVILQVPDSPKGDSRPDPAFHQWLTNPAVRDLVIHKRKS